MLRMKRIANIATRRKEWPADLIEEVLYDHELRFEQQSRQSVENKGMCRNEMESRQCIDIDTNDSPKGLERRVSIAWYSPYSEKQHPRLDQGELVKSQTHASMDNRKAHVLVEKAQY